MYFQRGFVLFIFRCFNYIDALMNCTMPDTLDRINPAYMHWRQCPIATNEIAMVTAIALTFDEEQQTSRGARECSQLYDSRVRYGRYSCVYIAK